MADRKNPGGDEESFLRLLREWGSPEAAGQGLLARLEALEAQVAAYEAWLATPEGRAAAAATAGDASAADTGGGADGAAPPNPRD